MAEPIRRRGQRRIALSVLALAAAVTTCRDAPSGPGGSRRGMVNIAPVFVGAMDPAAFGITIDSVRAVVIRPFIDTLADRTVAFPADSTALELDLPVLLHADVETLTVVLQYRGAGSVLFQGSRLVEVTAGPPGNAPPAEIPVLYIGPGAAVDSLVVTPADSIVSWGDSLRFQVAAFQGGLSVTQFYVSWTTTDTVNAPINGAGVLRAPNRRDRVFVIARTPGDSAVDSVAVTFMPLPSTITIVSGNNQSGSIGVPLAQALSVQVTAADGGGVALARVRYRVALGGGSVADTLVFTDDRGFAQTLATLGATVGAQAFEASFDASHFVRFDAAAIAGQAVRLEFTSQPVVTTAGIPVSPAVQVTARDSAGSVAAGFTGPVTVTLLANPGNGTLLGTTTVNAVAGIASFGTLVLERAAPGYTLLATAPNLTGDTSVAFTVVAASVDAVQSTVAAAPDTITASTGTSQSAITVTARDQFGNPIGGAAVVLAATGTGNTLVQPGTTNAAGTATGTLGSTVAAGKTVSATINGVAIVQTATVTVIPAGVSAAQSTVGAAPDTITAGSGPSTITVTARDQFGNPIGGAAVVLAATGTGNTLVQAAGPTGVNGVATGTLSSTVAAGKTVSATINSVAITQTATVTVIPAAASQIALNAGNNQTATVNTAVAIAPSVLVRDQFNNPVPGHAVTFSVTGGGGSVTGGNATTNASGIATVTSWTLGTTAGTNNNTLQATSAGLTGSPVTFTASATAAAASQITLNAGDNQTATVNTAVAIAPSVLARDPFNNPVAGVAVTFAVTGGGGAVVGGNATTDSSGIATVTSWTLGTTAGTNNNTVQATSAGLTGSPVTFTASATAAAASQITLNAGNNQTATVNTTVAIAPSVLVRDPFNNPVAGVAVSFAVTGGGGSVAGGNATTNASGIATVTSWTLGTTAGTNNNTLQATSAGLTGSPVTFTASATPAAASQLVFTTAPTTAVAGAGFLVQVTARDAFGNTATAFTGVVSLTLGANPGGSMFGSPSVSAVAGVAVFSVTLDKAGTGYTLVATSGALNVTSQPFDVTPAAASQMALNAGNNQTATVNTAVAIAPSVLVRDPFNNPVAGVAVTFAVTAGGGAVAGGSAVTNASGIATVSSWTLGTAAGTNNNTLQATSAGLAGSPVTFTASATAAAASQIALNAGNNQTATAGTAVAIAPSVIVRDAFGNPVAGVAVTFAVTGGGGSVAGGSATTNASGIATVTSWTLGTTAGTNNNTLAATSAGLTGSPVTFTASATAAAASHLVFTADPTTTIAGATMAPAVVVTVRDTFGNTTTTFNGNVAVAIATNPAGGTLSGTDTVAAVAGVATFTDLSIDRAGTGYTLTATSGSLLPAASATFNITAAAATQLAFTTQPTDAVAGVAITPTVVVEARDAFGNRATGFTANVTVGIGTNPGDGALSGTTTVAATAGVTMFADLSIDLAGTGYSLTAVADALAGATSLAFDITAAAASQLALVSGDGQTAVAGGLLPESLLVQVTDPFGNGVAGEMVTWEAVAGGGRVAPLSSVTDAGGFAATGWTLGPAAGTHLAQASSGSLAGSPVTFTATAFPTGMTSLWIGGDATAPTDWSTAGNWFDGRVPISSDNVFVPASAIHQPVVGTNAVAGDVVVQLGASVTIDPGVTLSVLGSVDAGATIVGEGTLAMGGSAVTLRGTVPALQISGEVTLSGHVSVVGSVIVGGSLDLGGQTVAVSGDFATTGAGVLRMTQDVEVMLVQGSVTFGGGETSGLLTAGSIAVSGDFVATESSATPFAAAGSHQVVLNGAALQRIDGVRSIRTTQSHFQNLVVASTDSVRPVTALQVNGTLIVSSGTFDVGGQSVFVGGDFGTTGPGILRMVSATDFLTVQGNAVFAGGNESAQLFDGVLRVAGDFAEAGSPPQGGSFEAVGNHLVEMNGSASQTISFGDPFLSHFGNLLISNTSAEGVTFLTDASAVDSLTVATGSRVSLGSSVFRLNDVINHGTLDVGPAGTLEVVRSFSHFGGAVLQGSGAVEVVGATVATFEGIVAPGASPGLLTISGGATLGSTSVVDIELGGVGTPGIDHDQLRVLNGTFTLGGTLNVGTLNGFAPKAGDSFQVLRFETRAGDFAAVTGLDLGGGVVLDTVWSATDLQLVARQVIALEVSPIDLATNPGKALVYALATPFGQKTGGPPMVMTIDATTNQPVDTVVLEAAIPYALSVNTVSEKVYVSDFQDSLIVVDAGVGSVDTIPLPQPGFTTVDESKNVVYLPAGVQVGIDPECIASFCPIYAPVLFTVDGTTDTVRMADTVFVGGWDWHAYGAAFNPNDGLVYVAIYDSARVPRNVVRVVDPGARAIVGSITVSGNPWAVAINPGTNKLYVSSDAANTVSVVNLSTGSVKPIAIGGYIPNITVDAGSNRIYVPNFDAGTVTIIDGVTDEVLTVLQVGAPGDGVNDVVVSPANGAVLYVARLNAGEITIQRP